MLGLAAILLGFSGSVALSLAMERHYRAATELALRPDRRRMLRAAGALLWLAALVESIFCWGAAPGTIVWLCCLPLAALPVALLLAFSPRRMVFAGMAALASSIFLLG